MSFKSRLVENLAPWNTGTLEEGLTDWERYLYSVAKPYEGLMEVAEETGSDGAAGYVPAYGKLFSAAECPAKDLGYLGQYVGVAIPSGSTEAEARQRVKEHAGFARGTPASIQAAITRILGVSEPYTLEERTGPSGEALAYWFRVIVPTGKATQALYNAINEVVPAGVFYTILEVSGDSWIKGSKKWSEISGGRKWGELTEGTF